MPAGRARPRTGRPAAQARRADPEEAAIGPRHGHPPRRPRLRAQQAAGPGDPGRDQDHPASRPPARRPRRRRQAAGPSWSTGSTRTRRARCWSRAPRARRAISRRPFRAAPRARSIGRWSSACPIADEGMIDAPLAKQPGTGGEKMHVDEEHGQPAKTRFRVIDRAGNRAAWVELQPLTGRTHQLRAHMAAIGHPIVGDAKYGGAEAFLTGGISRKLHLHARRIRIDAPERRQDRRHRRASGAFRRKPGDARVRADGRRHDAARHGAARTGRKAQEGRRCGQGAAARAQGRTALARVGAGEVEIQGEGWSEAKGKPGQKPKPRPKPKPKRP